jgi:hypothetical protein
VRESAQAGAAGGDEHRQLEHPARALDVDGAGLVEREGERDRGGRVDHLVRDLGKLVAPARVEPEAVPHQVAGERHHAVRHRLRVGDQRGQHVAHPALGVGLARGSHQRPHPPVDVAEQLRQQLHPEKAGGAGEQNVAAGAGAGVWREGHCVHQVGAPGRAVHRTSGRK